MHQKWNCVLATIFPRPTRNSGWKGFREDQILTQESSRENKGEIEARTASAIGLAAPENAVKHYISLGEQVALT